MVWRSWAWIGDVGHGLQQQPNSFFSESELGSAKHALVWLGRARSGNAMSGSGEKRNLT